MLGSVLLSAKPITLERFSMEAFPYGVDSVDGLVQLGKTGIPSSVVLGCLPFMTFEGRECLHCFDIFRRNHSVVPENVVVVGQPCTEDAIEHMGGCALLLPLFYLARTLPAT
jgi:hypothetical protein